MIKEETATTLLRDANVLGPHLSPWLSYVTRPDNYCVCKYEDAGPTLLHVMDVYRKRKWLNFPLKMYTTIRRHVFEHKAEVCEEIKQAYAILHNANILHGDVKLGNICIHPETFKISLIDFEETVAYPKEYFNVYYKAIMETSGLRNIIEAIQNFNI